MSTDLANNYAVFIKSLPRPSLVRVSDGDIEGDRRRLAGVFDAAQGPYVLYENVATGERRLVPAAQWPPRRQPAEPDYPPQILPPLLGSLWRRHSDGVACRVSCLAQDHDSGRMYVVYIRDVPLGVVEMALLAAWRNDHAPVGVAVKVPSAQLHPV